MSGQATWLTATLLLLGALAIALLAVVGTRLGRKYRAVRGRLACPASGELYEGVILTDPIDGRPLDVASCAAFDDPDQVTCAKACIKEHAAGVEEQRPVPIRIAAMKRARSTA